ncbi:MAG: hypothetical protein ACYS8W_20450 [Planctomycetota bacterium]|jgi:hypothetical protein
MKLSLPFKLAIFVVLLIGAVTAALLRVHGGKTGEELREGEKKEISK